MVFKKNDSTVKKVVSFVQNLKKNGTRKGCFEQKFDNNSNNIKAFYFDFDGTKKTK